MQTNDLTSQMSHLDECVCNTNLEDTLIIFGLTNKIEGVNVHVQLSFDDLDLHVPHKHNMTVHVQCTCSCNVRHCTYLQKAEWRQ